MKILGITQATEILGCTISSSNPASGNLALIFSSKGRLVFDREWSLKYADLHSFLVHLKETVCHSILIYMVF